MEDQHNPCGNNSYGDEGNSIRGEREKNGRGMELVLRDQTIEEREDLQERESYLSRLVRIEEGLRRERGRINQRKAEMRAEKEELRDWAARLMKLQRELEWESRPSPRRVVTPPMFEWKPRRIEKDGDAEGFRGLPEDFEGDEYMTGARRLHSLDGSSSSGLFYTDKQTFPHRREVILRRFEFPKVHRDYLEISTLGYFHIPWMIAPVSHFDIPCLCLLFLYRFRSSHGKLTWKLKDDRNYFTLLEHMTIGQIETLMKHTIRLRAGSYPQH
jgi:hypothetical protein